MTSAQPGPLPSPGSVSLDSVSLGSVRAGEIEKFDRLADQWWNPTGPMRALHAMNPLRVGWIDTHIHAKFGVPQRILDLGCGAGLASEALAQRGHDVLGVDAAPDAITAARAHADGQALPLAYRQGTAEALVAEGTRFPVVTALEIIEHVADPAAFLALLAELITPDGLVFVSTINRTLRSLAVAKIGAEYIARLLPTGTHDWTRFVTPAELSRAASAAGLRLVATRGMSFDLRTRSWQGSTDLSINYLAMLTWRSPAATPSST